VRYIEVEDYLTDDEAKQKWLSDQMAVIKNPEKRESAKNYQYKMFSDPNEDC
jgi:hypothetical protein